MEGDDDMNPQVEPEPAVISLLQRVPLLQRLSVKYNESAYSPEASEDAYRQVADIIRGLEYLEDLEWGASPHYMVVFKGDKEDKTWGIPSLRRLALRSRSRSLEVSQT